MIKKPVILFDGVCNLCNNAVDFIIRHDAKKQFMFVALQSEAGEKLVQLFGIPPDSDSVILIYEEKVYCESEAALKIARLLKFPWNLAVIFRTIPIKQRDKIYKWVARNRYKWFGKKNTCRLPAPAEKEFFPGTDELKL
jgi:predicted DCC family thiol-disulfide oxidoreductase YuxK